jgi:uncharacterized protein (TIGR03435 family)
MKTPLFFALATLAALAQTPAPRPEFDAASIRLNTDGGPIVFNGMKSLGTFSSQNQTLRNLIQEAYGVTSGQHYFLPYLKAPGQGVPILGGPPWLGIDRWNITAKWNAAPAGSPVTLELLQTARSQMDLMLRTLLEQRFQLKVHRETRDMPVYELTLVNPGKLKQATCAVFDPENPSPPSTEYCGSSRLGRKGQDWTLDGAGMKISELANTLSSLIGSRTIVDKTGFTGTFDAHLRWTPGQGEVGASVPASPDGVDESIFTALQDQLGLKLKTGRAPVEVIVIDNAEKPTPN